MDKLLTRDVTYKSAYTYEFGKIFRNTTPLWAAIIMECFEEAAYLVESGSNVHAKCTIRVFFPLGRNTYDFFVEHCDLNDIDDEDDVDDGPWLCRVPLRGHPFVSKPETSSVCINSGSVMNMHLCSNFDHSGDADLYVFDPVFTLAHIHDDDNFVIFGDFGECHNDTIERMTRIKSIVSEGGLDCSIFRGCEFDMISYLLMRRAFISRASISRAVNIADIHDFMEKCVQLVGTLLLKFDDDDRVNSFTLLIGRWFLGVTDEYTLRTLLPVVSKGCLCQMH